MASPRRYRSLYDHTIIDGQEYARTQLRWPGSPLLLGGPIRSEVADFREQRRRAGQVSGGRGFVGYTPRPERTDWILTPFPAIRIHGAFERILEMERQRIQNYIDSMFVSSLLTGPPPSALRVQYSQRTEQVHAVPVPLEDFYVQAPGSITAKRWWRGRSYRQRVLGLNHHGQSFGFHRSLGLCQAVVKVDEAVHTWDAEAMRRGTRWVGEQNPLYCQATGRRLTMEELERSYPE